LLDWAPVTEHTSIKGHKQTIHSNVEDGSLIVGAGINGRLAFKSNPFQCDIDGIDQMTRAKNKSKHGVALSIVLG
jgi:hypothetical protein